MSHEHDVEHNRRTVSPPSEEIADAFASLGDMTDEDLADIYVEKAYEPLAEAAKDELSSRHHDRIVRHCLESLPADPVAAERIAQESLAHYFKGAHVFENSPGNVANAIWFTSIYRIRNEMRRQEIQSDSLVETSA